MSVSYPPLGRVIVNADDFGCTSHITRDIGRCIAQGRVSSTTIMANMPAFAEACEAARDGGFLDRVGVHLNLTAGTPLTDPPLEFRDEQGHLAFPEIRRGGSSTLLRAAAAELRAQVRRVLDAGIRPTHFDSHNHVINGWPYLRIALEIARENGVSKIRLTRNAFHSASPAVTMLKNGFNMYLRFAGMHTTRWFTDVKPYIRHLAGGGAALPGIAELMCHPGSMLDGETDETAFLLGEPYGTVHTKMRLMSYGEL